MRKFIAWSLAGLALACGNPSPQTSQQQPQPADVVAQGEAVQPPFEVKGEADDLLLVWYDERGQANTATSRSDIPEARRATVRVDALNLPPDKRLDPAFVYVADLRAPAAEGRYAVRKVARAAFETSLEQVGSAGDKSAVAASSNVIIYGASWCGACKQAAQYFERKGVPFVEKDIEKEPDAREEMMTKAQAQGVRTGGIPVIDVKGTMVGGFNARRIEQLLASK